MASNNIFILESDDHHDDLVKGKIIRNDVTVYIFSASWCGPCKTFKPKWEKVSKQYPDVKFVYVDIDECPDLADANCVNIIPSVRIFKPGKNNNLFEVKSTEAELIRNIDIAIAK